MDEFKRYPLQKIRNIGIIAHIDAGKTTTTERILYYTGRTYKIGSVDEGTTVTDWMPQERERGITIVSAATTTFWQDHRINIIDTPGHLDFTAEVERSLRVLDGAVMVLDAEEGVQSQTETVSRQADRYSVPRLFFVNKMDKLGADFYKTLAMIQKRLGLPAVAYSLPIGKEESFMGIVDLLTRQVLLWEGDETGATYQTYPLAESPVKGDTELLVNVEKYRSILVEKITETDESLLHKFLEGVESSLVELKKAQRAAVVNFKLIPVLVGSSLRNKGVQPLLDAVVEYLPSPLDKPAVVGINPKTGQKLPRQISEDESLAALAFKVQTDPYVGRLTYFRVYAGKIAAGSFVLNASKNVKERLGRILLMHANQREEVKEIGAGEIGAGVGLKETVTGDTLCSDDSPIILESIKFPEPVISLAIEPKTKADREKLGEALKKLQEEDPTFTLKYDIETGQSLIAGMGELHLEIKVDRLKREFKIEANVGKPQVAYRETIKATVGSQEGKYIRQSGGRGQYGHVVIKLEPKSRGEGREFVDAVRGGAIPKNFIPAAEKGVTETLDSGVLAGYPLTDIKVTLLDGSFHEVDSSDIAFKLAAEIAVKEGIKKATPILLEPIMSLEVVVPEEYMGQIIGDLSSKRGQISETELRGNTRIVRGIIPLSEMFGYATILRSLTQGRGTFMMTPSHYQEVPAQITEQVVNRG